MNVSVSAAGAPRPTVSAVLITRNAAAHLRECLSSVSWMDEIVVLDGGSTDETAVLCREFGARFEQARDWQGFGIQKNRALERARSEWIFSIDADEVCTPELRRALEHALRTAGTAAAYEMPRCSSFCGRVVRHGGWWPDYVTRLFRRGQARFSDSRVHERLQVDGPVARLNVPLRHYSYDTLEQALEKMDRYSTLGARQAFEAGRRSTPLAAVLHGFWAFVRTYLVRLGFLDGWTGLVLARYNAHTTYYRYLKLWYLGRNAQPSQRDTAS
ncbi:MAG: glycosyltransferase family 2 protein [Nevskiales bacterium]|nr:glycosyltransferase family 2 protein [Nevskiales bacterium]